MSSSARRWLTHAGILLSLVLVHIAKYPGWWTGRSGGLNKFDATLLLICLLVYAAVTSLIMLGLADRRGGPWFLHGFLLSTTLGSCLYLKAEMKQHEARLQELEAQQRQSKAAH